MNKSNQMTNSRVSGGDDKAGRMAGREVFMNRLSGWMGQLLGAFVLSLVMLNVAYAVNMPTSGTATWTLSNGNVYDSGGPHGKYSNRNNASAIIYPGVAGQIVRVSGALQIEPGWDYIRIYDGAGTNNPILFESSSDKPGRWDPSCQSFSIPVITSTSGPLTIQFTSDNSVTCAGFNLAVSNVSPPMNAVFVSQSVPTTMTVGESYTVSVTMQNAGIEWSQVEAFKLGAQNPHDNSNWGFNRVELPAGTTVAMGQEHTFTFTVTAPLTEGNYNFQWRMLRENVDWFGETTPNVVVNVSAPPAPTTPSDTPLFLTNSAHPNIMWTLDDSSSMDWEFLAEESPAEKLPRIGLGNDLAAWLFYPGSNHSYNNAYVGTTSGSFYLRTAPSPRTSGFSDTWRYRTHHYNKLYYNPEITYRPWAGVDANGAPLYTNANPSAAIRYPDSHWYTGGQTLNLTTDFSFSTPTTGSWNVSQTIFPAKYYAWNDPRGDGEVRADDTHVMVKINDPNAAYDGGVNREDCVAHTDAPYKCTYEEEIQNFANWFQYHRSRSLVAKGAVGKLVSETTGTRMGWYSMRLRSSGPRYAVQTMDQTTRAALLSSLYSHTIGQQAFGTPSRTTMQYVGNYFKGNDSPILPYGQGGECQLNFNLLLTDGYWSSDDSVYVYDTDNDGVNNTLADVAYYYFRDPLKTFAENKVPPVTNPITNATITHPHLITYGISFGAPGVLDPWKFNPTSLNCWINTGGTSCWHDAADAQSHNIDPTDVADAKIDDLWHAAWNTTGQYISAMSPDELASALKSSLAHIIDRAGSAAAVSFNASTLSEDTALFLAQFNTNGWSGKLFKYPLDASDGTVQSTADWEAGHELTQRTSDRVILTRNPLITNDTGGVAFRWENLSNQQKDDFRTNPDGTQSNDVMAIARLNYVRGDRTNEGSGYQFRPRTSRLGDIIHSNPVYVGEPQMRWPSESPFPTGVNSFATWKKSSVKDREPVVYVGANDGMMHGFRASDGEEVLAYVPSHLY
jgi:type IV pilus assembly protein PilY1